MPKSETFEYAVIRFVPRVEREEFLNIGVVVFSKRMMFLGLEYYLDEHKLRVFSPEVELSDLRNYLDSWDFICKGDRRGGAIALAEMPYRFRWITAPKSTIIQCSNVHPGITNDAEEVLNDLLRKYVL